VDSGQPNKVGLKCLSIRMFVHTQKVTFISMKFVMKVEVDEWCTMVCSMTWSKVEVKVTSLWKLEILAFSKATWYFLRHLQWELAT